MVWPGIALATGVSPGRAQDHFRRPRESGGRTARGQVQGAAVVGAAVVGGARVTTAGVPTV